MARKEQSKFKKWGVQEEEGSNGGGSSGGGTLSIYGPSDFGQQAALSSSLLFLPLPLHFLLWSERAGRNRERRPKRYDYAVATEREGRGEERGERAHVEVIEFDD